MQHTGLTFHLDKLGALCLVRKPLCIGLEEQSLILVKTGDSRKLTFSGLIEEVAAAASSRKRRLLALSPSSSGLLVLKNKMRALSAFVNKHNHQERVATLHIDRAEHATRFIFDGQPWRMSIRLSRAENMTLAVSSLNMPAFFSAGNPMIFTMGINGTISPIQSPHLCLGSIPYHTHVALTWCASSAALHFDADTSKALDIRRRHEETMRKRATVLSEAARERLAVDGFARFSNVIPSHVIDEAKAELLRDVGTGVRSVHHYKSNIGTGKRAVVNLVKESMIPYLLENMIRNSPDHNYWREAAVNAQIALRFPGDGCVPNTTSSSEEHYARKRRGWHIDGTASSENGERSSFFGRSETSTSLLAFCFQTFQNHFLVNLL